MKGKLMLIRNSFVMAQPVDVETQKLLRSIRGTAAERRAVFAKLEKLLGDLWDDLRRFSAEELEIEPCDSYQLQRPIIAETILEFAADTHNFYVGDLSHPFDDLDVGQVETSLLELIDGWEDTFDEERYESAEGQAIVHALAHSAATFDVSATVEAFAKLVAYFGPWDNEA